ncbi:MAG: SDR family NAD(P)-dependent oxidoreductase [Nocardioidaceae bacterium]|nr:SDR family NAD(P)-dependent oxidoreductase [Nocardioidaceae bacterium]
MITGPTAGIGRAFARALASEGHDLVLVSRDEQRLQQVADDLGAAHGVNCEVLRADLSDMEQTQIVEARLRKEPFDMLVNNAGFGVKKPFHDSDLEAEQAGLDVMVRAVMRLTWASLGEMLAAGRGDIVNISSVAGFLPRGTYGAHKAWVTSFSSWANVRYRHKGVRVMALCPGFVRTEFHSRMDADMTGTADWMWLDADDVVRTALRDLRRGKAVSIPSKRYKLIVGVSHLSPRGLTERIARRGR